ncbi:MAG: hypothetical protein Q7T53_13175 [Deltaproteobacteria bacterium]|nr:hypothetical protein [Deltaproteobacteria bacterium]
MAETAASSIISGSLSFRFRGYLLKKDCLTGENQCPGFYDLYPAASCAEFSAANMAFPGDDFQRLKEG